MGKPHRAWLGDKLLWAILLLVALVVGLPHSEPLFASLFPQLERPVYRQEPFAQLLWQHLLLVSVSGAASVLVGTLAGVWVTRPKGRSFRPVVETLVSMGQTLPPVAVLALALYGLLPVVQATITGLQAVPAPVMQAANGMGLSPWQRLRQVEGPLALPVWLSGVRTSVIINIGTAAIASTVGAKTLGSPIIVGLSGFNTAYVLQGAVLVGMLAVLVDMGFERLARRVDWAR